MKTKVARFWLQPTESFPDGAPQREEYESDRDHDFACLDYAAEWEKKYECMASPCRNCDCPQHGPALVAQIRGMK